MTQTPIRVSCVASLLNATIAGVCYVVTTETLTSPSAFTIELTMMVTGNGAYLRKLQVPPQYIYAYPNSGYVVTFTGQLPTGTLAGTPACLEENARSQSGGSNNPWTDFPATSYSCAYVSVAGSAPTSFVFDDKHQFETFKEGVMNMKQ